LKSFKHSYITLKQQSLDKIAIFGGFFAKESAEAGAENQLDDVTALDGENDGF
jgi:hypothetical protein